MGGCPLNQFDPKTLYFIPLGGTGEIGMNLNLYGWGGQWLMLDCGMLIDNDAEDPDARILVPDISFIAARRKSLAGLVITHAHEDHIGAVAALIPKLRCPIYATPFAAEVLKGRLAEAGQSALLKVQKPGSRFQVGPFKLEFVPITHSTPESQSVVVGTPRGQVLHTGDWKLDPDPLVGATTARRRFQQLGDQRVIAAVADSTNATIEGHSGSEAEVRENLLSLLEGRPGRVVATCFSSNIARIQSLIEAAVRSGRHPVLVGRSMERMVRAALATRYLPRDLPFVGSQHAGFLPADKALILCTGSQGEAAAALPRMARDAHRDVFLEPGDVALFSSKIIPGNEVQIAALHQALEKKGVQVLCERDALVHVSGHPCREELAEMYGWVKPEVVIPVHGYPQHLDGHAEWCEHLGIPSLRIQNGDVVQIAPGPAEVVGKVQVGRVVRPEPRNQPPAPKRGRRTFRPRRR